LDIDFYVGGLDAGADEAVCLNAGKQKFVGEGVELRAGRRLSAGGGRRGLRSDEARDQKHGT
jgi:hypothetical protein